MALFKVVYHNEWKEISVMLLEAKDLTDATDKAHNYFKHVIEVVEVEDKKKIHEPN